MICLYENSSGKLLGGYNLDSPFFNHTMQAQLLNEKIARLLHQGITFKVCSENQYFNQPQPNTPKILQ